MNDRFLVLATLVVVGCGTTSPNTDSGTSDSGVETGADSDCPGSTGSVTVRNFDGWCTVSVNGSASTTSDTSEACVPLGNSTGIVVGPASASFELGPNPFVRVRGLEVPDGSVPLVTGDGGLGSTSKLIVGVSSSGGCVLVCCPFADGSGCDSTYSGYTSFLSECP